MGNIRGKYIRFFWNSQPIHEGSRTLCSSLLIQTVYVVLNPFLLRVSTEFLIQYGLEAVGKKTWLDKVL